MKHDQQLQNDVERELCRDPSVSAAIRISNARAVAREIRDDMPNAEIRIDGDIARTAATSPKELCVR